ncbi:hypothetical protein DL93DRAFT_709295 [Clavulina sp. PMI_390]|nr:hypothetical protein DL93DRAFT_709295 [Clavulina sp. PMI_390]
MFHLVSVCFMLPPCPYSLICVSRLVSSYHTSQSLSILFLFFSTIARSCAMAFLDILLSSGLFRWLWKTSHPHFVMTFVMPRLSSASCSEDIYPHYLKTPCDTFSFRHHPNWLLSHRTDIEREREMNDRGLGEDGTIDPSTHKLHRYCGGLQLRTGKHHHQTREEKK